MGDDEIVGPRWGEGAGINAVQPDAINGSDASGARLKQSEHGRAQIDDISVEIRVQGEQADEKATVSVSENEGAASVFQILQKVEAAAFEDRTEGEVLEPAVWPGDAVEILPHHRSTGRKSSGVSNAASAAMRSCVRPRNDWSRSAKKTAEMAQAA